MIYKTFFGKTVNLAKLISVSEVYYSTESVGFELLFEGNTIISYERSIAWNEMTHERYNENPITGRYETRSEMIFKDGVPLAKINVQEQLNEILKVWESLIK